ncbi:MAG TPA: hypothetical protein VGM53_15665 [Streptosporangiaceae bacterium]
MTLDTTAADRGTGRFRLPRRRGPGMLAVTAAAVLACVMAAGCGSGRPAQGLPAEHRAHTAASPRAGGGSPATSTPLADGADSPAGPAAPAAASPGPGVTATPARGQTK